MPHGKVLLVVAALLFSTSSTGCYWTTGDGPDVEEQAQISFYRCTGCSGKCVLVASNELRSN